MKYKTQLAIKLEEAGFKTVRRKKSKYWQRVKEQETLCIQVFNDSLRYFQDKYVEPSTVYSALSQSLECLGRDSRYMLGRFVWGKMLRKLEVL